eukprot:2889916-Rhodomonas_salina.1
MLLLPPSSRIFLNAASTEGCSTALESLQRASRPLPTACSPLMWSSGSLLSRTASVLSNPLSPPSRTASPSCSAVFSSTLLKQRTSPPSDRTSLSVSKSSGGVAVPPQLPPATSCSSSLSDLGMCSFSLAFRTDSPDTAADNHPRMSPVIFPTLGRRIRNPPRPPSIPRLRSLSDSFLISAQSSSSSPTATSILTAARPLVPAKGETSNADTLPSAESRVSIAGSLRA